MQNRHISFWEGEKIRYGPRSREVSLLDCLLVVLVLERYLPLLSASGWAPILV